MAVRARAAALTSNAAPVELRKLPSALQDSSTSWPLAWHVRLRVGSAQRGLENTHCCEIALLASALLDSMASLVVDAAYVHHGTAASSADNINGWSEAALKKDKAESVQAAPRVRARPQHRARLLVRRARRPRRRGGDEARQAAAQGGFPNVYRRIKMDEVVCRNRDCVAAGTCPHLHRSNPRVRCRRQAGVDVDVACRALQFITEQLMSETSWQSSTWTHAQQAAQPWLVLVAGDGDFLSLVETAKRLGAKVAVAAWRRSVHDDLVETADAFLALDDDDVVWNESDEEEDDDDASSAAPRSRRRRRSSCRRSCRSVVRLLARRRRCRPLPTTSCRARSPSRRCWRGSTRRPRTTVETTTSLRGPSRNRPTARPRGAPAHNLEAPRARRIERGRAGFLRAGDVRRAETSGNGEASLRHPELTEPDLERTPRSWVTTGRRPRHPELDSDSEDGLDTRPGMYCKWPAARRAASPRAPPPFAPAPRRPGRRPPHLSDSTRRQHPRAPRAPSAPCAPCAARAPFGGGGRA